MEHGLRELVQKQGDARVNLGPACQPQAGGGVRTKVPHPVRSLRPHVQPPPVPRPRPSGVHQQRVVDERVLGRVWCLGVRA